MYEPTDSPVRETEIPVFTEEPMETEEPTRAVYDGSISDSYLRSLSGYYNLHAKLGTPYVISRPSQYVYQLVYGDSSDGSHFTDATIVRLTVGNYGTNSTISVTSSNSVTVDVSGSTAYVYSSVPAFLPSSYINDSPRILSFAVFGLLGLFAVSCLVRFIWSLLKR